MAAQKPRHDLRFRHYGAEALEQLVVIGASLRVQRPIYRLEWFEPLVLQPRRSRRGLIRHPSFRRPKEAFRKALVAVELCEQSGVSSPREHAAQHGVDD